MVLKINLNSRKDVHPKLDLGIACVNISIKNPFWCELTTLYWGGRIFMMLSFLV